jgi:hypothetical protein
MSAPGDFHLFYDDELLSKILKSILSLLPPRSPEHGRARLGQVRM